MSTSRVLQLIYKAADVIDSNMTFAPQFKQRRADSIIQTLLIKNNDIDTLPSKEDAWNVTNR